MRRRRSRGRRSSGSRRKIEWIGSHVWITHQGFAHGDMATWWLKWPAGHVDDRGAVNFFESVDDTLVRLMWTPYLFVDTPSTPEVHFWTFGAIAFDAEDADSLEGNIFNASALIAPDPYFAADDWILRKVYIDCVSSETGGNDGFFPTMDWDMQSRAMRKLPPNRGVLGVLSHHEPESAQVQVCTAGVDARLAVKTGFAL